MVEGNSGEMAGGAGGGASETQHSTADSGKQVAIVKRKLVSDTKPVLFQPGMLQDLMSEVRMYVGLFMCVLEMSLTHSLSLSFSLSLSLSLPLLISRLWMDF